jgi:hypothetical protein
MSVNYICEKQIIIGKMQGFRGDLIMKERRVGTIRRMKMFEVSRIMAILEAFEKPVKSEQSISSCFAA